MSRKAWSQFLSSHDLCLTGEALAHLLSHHPTIVRRLLAHVRVFARTNPKQKEAVVTSLKALGYTTLMCGDGTNDVGALKHSHVGVAILSSVPEKKKKKKDAGEEDSNDVNKPITMENDKFDKLKKDGKGKRQMDSAPSRRANPNNERLTAQQQKLQKMLKELQEAEEAAIVKLGDASIAAPFTSKSSSITSINHVIKQGRCTLVTTCLLYTSPSPRDS